MINSIMSKKLFQRAGKIIRNEKGGIDPIIGLIFGAILILAVIALRGPILTFFSTALTNFTTWALGKLTTLFS